MNIPTNLSPTKALAFAAALPDPKERQALLENLVQRPWSEQDQTRAVLATLGVRLEQLQSPKPQPISSGLDHFVVDNVSPTKKLQDFQPKKSAVFPKPPQKKRYYRYPPNVNYTLDEAFAAPDNKAPTLLPLLPLLPLLALQASLNAAKTKPALLDKADLQKIEAAPSLHTKGSSKLSEYRICIPGPQSTIAKSKKPGVILTQKR